MCEVCLLLVAGILITRCNLSGSVGLKLLKTKLLKKKTAYNLLVSLEIKVLNYGGEPILVAPTIFPLLVFGNAKIPQEEGRKK